MPSEVTKYVVLDEWDDKMNDPPTRLFENEAEACAYAKLNATGSGAWPTRVFRLVEHAYYGVTR